jgi:hypothetical protein
LVAAEIAGYTGTTTYLGLKKIGEFDTEEKANEAADKNWNDCAGLINIFEVSTNKAD